MPGSSSAIAIGSTPPTSASAGTGLWIDRTGLYSLSSGTYQVKIDASSGKLYGGGGNVYIDNSGLSIIPGSVFSNAAAIKFVGSANIWGTSDSGLNSLFLSSLSDSTNNSSQIRIQATKYTGGSAELTMIAGTDGMGVTYASVSLLKGTDDSNGVFITGDTLSISGALGSCSVNLTGNIQYTGVLQSYKNSTAYTGYIEVPLSTPINAASYYTAGFSSASNAWIDVSAQFSGVPDNIKGIKLSVTIRDSGSDGGDYYVGFASSNTTD